MRNRVQPIDIKILVELSQNSRLTYTELARRCGISRQAVNNRIKKMKRMGILRGFTTIINPSSLGLGVHAFIMAKAKNLNTFSMIERSAIEDPRVAKVYRVVNANNLILLEVLVADIEELSALTRKLSTMSAFFRIYIIGEIAKDAMWHPLENFLASLKSKKSKSLRIPYRSRRSVYTS